MSVRLLILGFLAEGPKHGYLLKQRITSTQFGTEVKPGSIYHALNSLTKSRMVTGRTEIEAGGRTRRVYEITAAGRAEVLNLLRGAFQGVEPFHFPFDAAVTFMDALAKRELLIHLLARREKMKQVCAYLENNQGAAGENGQAGDFSAYELVKGHHLHHYRAEVGWLDGVIERIREAQA